MAAVTDSFEPEPRIPWIRRVVSLVILAALVAGGAYGGWYLFFRSEQAANVAPTLQEVTVTRGRIVNSLSTTGTAQSTLTSKLTFQSSGQVKTIGVAVGDQVKAGQELARLDDKDANRKLETAAANLEIARLRLAQLTEPPTAADLATAHQSTVQAQQSIASAQSQLATAQSNLDKAIQGPAAADVIALDLSVLQAESGVKSAQGTVDSSFASLVNAQRTYCDLSTSSGLVSFPLVRPCSSGDLPLSAQNIADLQYSLTAPPASPSSSVVQSYLTAATGLLNANQSHLNARNSFVISQKSLESAKAKRDAAIVPADAATLALLRAQVATADAGVRTAESALSTAQTKEDDLLHGTTVSASDLALQQQSYKLSQISYQQQVDAMDTLVIRAPFDGTVAAVGMLAGDFVSGATAAFTLTNPGGVRVDLTVSETDLPNLKAGLYGVATFDAMPGQTYVVKITAVANSPTTSQGVTTYPVQAQILRQADIQANAAGLQQVASVLLSGGRGGATGSFNPQGATGTPGAQGTRGAQQGTPGAQGTRGSQQGTPGAQGTRGAQQGTPGAQNGGPGAQATPGAQGGGQQSGGLAGLQQLFNSPLPSPGMSASVVVVTSILEDTLLVPNAAVRRQGRTSYVLMPKGDGTNEQRTVGVGGSDTTNTSITSGLNEGDKVLIGAVTTGTATASRTVQTTGGGPGPGGFNGGPTPPGGVR